MATIRSCSLFCLITIFKYLRNRSRFLERTFTKYHLPLTGGDTDGSVGCTGSDIGGSGGRAGGNSKTFKSPLSLLTKASGFPDLTIQENYSKRGV